MSVGQNKAIDRRIFEEIWNQGNLDLERVEERLDRLEQTVQALAEAQQRTEEHIQTLIKEVQRVSRWQFGEDGRRAGEQYER